MRDAAFTVDSFLRIGFRDEAAAFMGWIEDYASKHVNPKATGAVVFTVMGDTQLPEQTWSTGKGIEDSDPSAWAMLLFHSSRERSRASSWTRHISPTST
jgi:hypothetical protein